MTKDGNVEVFVEAIRKHFGSTEFTAAQLIKQLAPEELPEFVVYRSTEGQLVKRIFPERALGYHLAHNPAVVKCRRTAAGWTWWLPEAGCTCTENEWDVTCPVH